MSEEMKETQNTNETKDYSYLIVNFYKSDVVKRWQREKDNMKMVTIAFPKNSQYHGYVWFYPEEWTRESKFNKEKLTVSLKKENTVRITKSEKNEENNQYQVVDSKELTALELKEEMKRPYKGEKEEDGEVNEFREE